MIALTCQCPLLPTFAFVESFVYGCKFWLVEICGTCPYVSYELLFTLVNKGAECRHM